MSGELGAVFQKEWSGEDNRTAARAITLLTLAQSLCSALGLDASPLNETRLRTLAEKRIVSSELESAIRDFAQLSSESAAERHLEAAHRVGEGLDLLLASEISGERRRAGSYFTPHAVAKALIRRALDVSSLGDEPRICDPACGGGAFLLEAAAALSAEGQDWSMRRASVADEIYGFDLSELAIAVVEIALWLFVGDETRRVNRKDRFLCGDALVGRIREGDECAIGKSAGDLRPFHFHQVLSDLFGEEKSGFDWIVGNPPWVAFQGRATQKITPERRAYYRGHFRAFKGYPTLHGLFIERATHLAPTGVITLLVPSSVSDLEGYREARASVGRGHRVAEPLLEFGQDAFEGVVQPCFGLIAVPGAGQESESSGDSWVLEERTRAGGRAAKISPPSVLAMFDQMEPLPPETFREMGFQSNRAVSAIFHRGEAAPEKSWVALLEGRNVGEFAERAPKLFIDPGHPALSETKCRLRPKEDYHKVDFVVRQTAAFTIAAMHAGERFRNSLIGGFATDTLDAPLLVGLLNSALFRALHVSRQRDARQAAFPQVKLMHLRVLPKPPSDPSNRKAIQILTQKANDAGGLDADSRIALDEAVFRLFGVPEAQRNEILSYLREAAPKALEASL